MKDVSKSIIGTKGCYGCGICVRVCGKHILDLKLNSDGFYEPVAINADGCTNCGMCSSVCSFHSTIKTYTPIKAYAGWSKNVENRKNSSSGGVAYELARYALSINYSFIGVRYNVEKKCAEHYITDNVDELKESQGSKYLQSFTIDALKQINRKKKYIFIGTPCQVASMRLFIEKCKLSENIILIDFFCHGVPSYTLWNKYLKEHSKGIDGIYSISWRNKERGWHNSYCITIEGENKKNLSYRENDDFFSFFLGDACLGKACYDSCKFKSRNSCADIRLGDFWGKEYSKNEDGVCSVVINTDKGYNILSSSGVELKEHSFEMIYQGQMKVPARRPWYYAYSSHVLKKEKYRLTILGAIIRNYKIIISYLQRINSMFSK